MQKIDKKQFIKDIKEYLGIHDRNIAFYDEIIDFKDTFNDFFEMSNELVDVELNNPNNIYVNCKITPHEAIVGCKKKIKFERFMDCDKKEKVCFSVKIPANIQNGQKIIVRGEGNRNAENNGNLIISIKI